MKWVVCMWLPQYPSWHCQTKGHQQNAFACKVGGSSASKFWVRANSVTVLLCRPLPVCVVIAMRLLATAAAQYSLTSTETNSSSSSKAVCGSTLLPIPLLQVLQHLRTSLAPESVNPTPAGAAEGAAAAAATGATGNTDSTAPTWPFTLGPDGVAAAAQLITR
jgi:hypothetical protein